ncbi:MAG: hypothetical protein QM775_18470 [Pirellulales bacterium]
MKSLALMLVAAAMIGWTSQAEAGQGRSPCAPNVAQQNTHPTQDVVSSAPATGTRSMSVEPAAAAAPVRYYSYSRPSRAPKYTLPKWDVRRLSTGY